MSSCSAPRSQSTAGPDRGKLERGMSVQLNHTIVAARDSRRSAEFMAEILGLAAPVSFGPFIVVTLANGVSLAFDDTDGPIDPRHYAFLVSEPEFDEIFARIAARGLTWWADPGRRRAGEINQRDGGRGLYFDDPDRHLLEILTRPYGSRQ
jgi:catechol 2,3-dioxygenase-like lactoylglutathione lyase family enzyme